MKINTRWVQLKGKIEVPEDLDREKYVILGGEFEHQDYKEKPNQDGSADIIYTLLPIRVKIESGLKQYFGKPKKRQSQRLRAALWHHYNTLNLSEEYFDDWYSNVTDKMIVHLEEIINFIK
ncbi:MAG: hypothetical protein ACLGJB_03790 [Blastocatellia bacterium]